MPTYSVVSLVSISDRYAGAADGAPALAAELLEAAQRNTRLRPWARRAGVSVTAPLEGYRTASGAWLQPFQMLVPSASSPAAANRFASTPFRAALRHVRDTAAGDLQVEVVSLPAGLAEVTQVDRQVTDWRVHLQLPSSDVASAELR